MDGANRFRYELDAGQSVSNGIVTAVASVIGATTTPRESTHGPDPLPPLHTVVDPDALNSLFRPASDASVTLTNADCRVVADSGGVITVRPETPAETASRDDGSDEANW